MVIGLDNPKSGMNVGSVLGAASCFEADFICHSGPAVQVSEGGSDGYD